jgi:two-component system sensor histidine kinase ChvG
MTDQPVTGGLAGWCRSQAATSPWAGRTLWLPASQVGLAAASGALGMVAVLADGPAAQLALAGVGGLGLASGRMLSRRVVRPLVHLAETMEHVRGCPGVAPRIDPALLGRSDGTGRIARALDDVLAGCARNLAANEEAVADLAHEVRNPLASLRSAAEALQQADGERHLRLLQIVKTDVQRLDRLLEELSRAARLDAEMVVEASVVFDFVAVVRRLMPGFEQTCEARGVELIPDLPATPVEIRGIEARLTQVVANVVENAMSLCEAGDAIRIGARCRDGRLLFVVEDTGPGIPDGAVQAIFRRFYTQRDPDRGGRNSGLGLAIARQIVEAHGGMIWAENIRPTSDDLLSEPLGARFVTALPL